MLDDNDSSKTKLESCPSDVMHRTRNESCIESNKTTTPVKRFVFCLNLKNETLTIG